MTRLEIRPVIKQAAAVEERVRSELPTHEGLQRATLLIVNAAKKAEEVAASMKRPWSPHRLPVMFLGAAAWIRKDQMAAASEASGVQGTPSLATAELGKLYLDMKIDNAVNQIRAFRAGSR